MGLVIPDYLGKNEGVIDTGNLSNTEPKMLEILQ
jgi:hypothetical protein